MSKQRWGWVPVRNSPTLVVQTDVERERFLPGLQGFHRREKMGGKKSVLPLVSVSFERNPEVTE